MEKNMKINFAVLKDRVIDSLDHTDLERIRKELKKLDKPTITSGVGGSSVVSEFASRMLNQKNKIITSNKEPRDFLYENTNGYSNVIACSYSGNNFGVDLSFQNDLKKYLLSNNAFANPEVTYLDYKTTMDKERSFISLGATLIPISILMDYYEDGKQDRILDSMKETKFLIENKGFVYEIFSGKDTSTTSKYLESTLVESGIGVPIVHDKYSFCHGRTTFGYHNQSTAIYLNRNTDFDKILLEELKPYYDQILVIDSLFQDPILDDYQMLIQAMYLTKQLAEQKGVDLSKIDYSPVVKQLYKYSGNI